MHNIYIEDTGKGFPLVLVHGFLGSSKMWQPQISFFKKKFRVIAPDLPGFGESKNIKSYKSIKSIATLLINCLKEKKIDKYILLGHSMGGMIVQEMAKINGEKISKLVCYSTGPIGEMPGRFETIEKSREKLKKNGLQITALRIAKTWFIKKEKAKYFYLCSVAGKSTSFKTADNALIAMKNWKGLKNLKSIKNETLILWGDKDKSYSLDQAKTLNKNIKNSKLKIFKGCSHNIHLEKPNDFNETINEFIKK
jgi:pimeloyl-ACP methyl ester carboxylesterase